MTATRSLLALVDPLRAQVASWATFPPKWESQRETIATTLVPLVQNARPDEPLRLCFICTHNSRRSHFAHVWAQTAAEFYGVAELFDLGSGGTEATACDTRTVAALRRSGFSVVRTGSGENPHYLVQGCSSVAATEVYSKTFAEFAALGGSFVAMMCCADVSETCPHVPGAVERIPLHYRDPKEADDTPEEVEVYDTRCRQIGQEMFALMDALYAAIAARGAQ